MNECNTPKGCFKSAVIIIGAKAETKDNAHQGGINDI
jgi:hypothetical protein